MQSIDLLDYFAAAALSGLMASDDPGEVNAQRCFEIAARMAEESARRKAQRERAAAAQKGIPAVNRATPYAGAVRFDDE